jgi:hypothetical protein
MGAISGPGRQPKRGPPVGRSAVVRADCALLDKSPAAIAHIARRYVRSKMPRAGRSRKANRRLSAIALTFLRLCLRCHFDYRVKPIDCVVDFHVGFFQCLGLERL